VAEADFEAYSRHMYEAACNGSGQGGRLIFVGGAPRSGTTLVQNMLDCHGEIYGGPEFLHIPDIVRVRSRLHGSIARKWIDLICSYEQVDRMIAAWIEAFLLPLADSQKARFISEKTPENVLVFPQLIELFPKARFILVARDPRAIVSSMLEVGAKARVKGLEPPFFTNDLAAAVSYTIDCIEKGFKAVEAAPERVYIVVYERLVREPAQETKALCDFLQIAWEPGMIRPASKKHAGEKAITVFSNELWYDTEAYYKDPNSDRINRWQQQLSPTDQVTIAHSFSDSQGLRALGYDFSVASYSPLTRLLGAGRVRMLPYQRGLASRFGRYVRRLRGRPRTSNGTKAD
jgi:protein-tyrosine sulfotransferase